MEEQWRQPLLSTPPGAEASQIQDFSLQSHSLLHTFFKSCPNHPLWTISDVISAIPVFLYRLRSLPFSLSVSCLLSSPPYSLVHHFSLEDILIRPFTFNIVCSFLHHLLLQMAITWPSPKHFLLKSNTPMGLRHWVYYLRGMDPNFAKSHNRYKVQ